MHNLMIYLIKLVFIALKSKRELIAENLMLRQQLQVVNRNKPDLRSKIDGTDRTIMTISKNFISDWKKLCFVFNPDTLLKWHRQLAKGHWAWVSHKRNQQEKEINGRSKTIDYSDETGKYDLESRTNQRRTAQDKYSCKQKDYTKSI